MSAVLLPSCYFPPISYFVMINEYNGASIDVCENYQKQTYRNRCEILGANGKLDLIIPVQHNGEREMKKVEIDNSQDWQAQHLKSIKSAYQSSPYYEYYEDKIRPLYEQEYRFLVQFNQTILSLCFDILKWEPPINIVEQYDEDFKGNDARGEFSPKETSKIKFAPYHQVFEDRLEFQPNLSIFDLICNLGPESLKYIQDSTTK